MKFVMVTTYAAPKNIRRELLSAIGARGHQVTVVAPESPAVMCEPLAEIGVAYVQWPVNRTGLDPREDLKSARHLYSILRDLAPDVVMISQIKAVLLAPLAAKLAQIPHITALVNGLGATFDDHGFGISWRAKVARRLYGIALRGIDTIVFQNSDDPKLLRELGFLSARATVCVVPGTGVDVQVLQPLPPHTKPPTFTLVSRLIGSKGIRDFVAAARILRVKYPDARFILVGQLEDHPDGVTRTEIDGWVAEGLIDYRGFTLEIPAILATTTAFVLPSYYREGVPRTNLEAMALARPVVTTDWVGCRETVKDGVNGFLVMPKDPEAIAERLDRYLRDPALIAQHGRQGRRIVEATFDIRRVNELMITALGLD